MTRTRRCTDVGVDARVALQAIAVRDVVEAVADDERLARPEEEAHAVRRVRREVRGRGAAGTGSVVHSAPPASSAYGANAPARLEVPAPHQRRHAEAVGARRVCTGRRPARPRTPTRNGRAAPREMRGSSARVPTTPSAARSVAGSRVKQHDPVAGAAGDHPFGGRWSERCRRSTADAGCGGAAGLSCGSAPRPVEQRREGRARRRATSHEGAHASGPDATA